MKSDNQKEKITIIAHLPHFRKDTIWEAYEPYVREIEVWAAIFQNVLIYTDIQKKRPAFPLKTLPSNCHIKPIYLRSGPGLKNNLIRIVQLPFVAFHIFIILIKSDLIHLRSPGATTLIANLWNRLLNKRIIIKWATTFEEMPYKENIIRWERRLLQNPSSNVRVLIYGVGHKSNHISFIPALFTSGELSEIESKRSPKNWTGKIKLLCVGRLFRYKNFDLALNGLVKFKQKYPNYKWELIMIGDGEMREALENIIKSGGISNNVKLLGSLSFRETQSWYLKSHILIMPGKYEGWPKVINEAWATGCIPFVVDVKSAVFPLSFAPGSGEIFQPDADSFADSLALLLSYDSEKLDEIATRGRLANHKMTLEKFKEKLDAVINEMILER